ncbi:hypothetical protein KAW18_15640 [candidate division WOR-3 bacterium]|nr:hypothetical protein [candidate division WOR-3 bacterium]MCK4528800.1 hypothetical protein [candidate division WOR-3 bacterium]
MDSAKRERCSHCGSIELINNIYVKEGEPVRVYVQCSKCGEFVARYTVDYYTSDKKYESLLRFVSTHCFDSGRNVCKRVESFDEGIKKEFERCKKLIKDKEEEKNIEEIITDKEEKK